MNIYEILQVSVALFVLLLILCWVSEVVRFYAKSAALYGFLIINSIITVPYGLWHFKEFRKTSLFSSSFVDYASFILGIKWKVDCNVHFDKTKSYIIVCNHQSAVDVLGMMKIWPHLGHSVAIAKSELKYLGPFGLCLYLCGTIFLDRISGEKGHKAINEASRKAKASGTSIFIFPEGTRNRNRDGALLPFKKGAFHMALDNAIPILPVVISQYDFLDAKKKIFNSGEATIKVLEPIPIENYEKEQIQQLIDDTWKKMSEVFASMSKKA